MTKLWTAALDLLYPPKCAACGRLGERLVCLSCRVGFERPPGAICEQCGAVLSDGQCRACTFSPPRYLSGARAAGVYAGPLREAIIKFKYTPLRPLNEPLGELLVEMLSKRPFWPATFDSIVPVPLHPSRERERGFNQSELLAEHVGGVLGLLQTDILINRIRSTRQQTGLSAVQRRENVTDAFEVIDATAVNGKTILLVDDVMTTLATTEECARVLLDAGARAVYAVALAREHLQ